MSTPSSTPPRRRSRSETRASGVVPLNEFIRELRLPEPTPFRKDTWKSRLRGLSAAPLASSSQPLVDRTIQGQVARSSSSEPRSREADFVSLDLSPMIISSPSTPGRRRQRGRRGKGSTQSKPEVSIGPRVSATPLHAQETEQARDRVSPAESATIKHLEKQIGELKKELCECNEAAQTTQRNALELVESHKLSEQNLATALVSARADCEWKLTTQKDNLTEQIEREKEEKLKAQKEAEDFSAEVSDLETRLSNSEAKEKKSHNNWRSVIGTNTKLRQELKLAKKQAAERGSKEDPELKSRLAEKTKEVSKLQAELTEKTDEIVTLRLASSEAEAVAKQEIDVQKQLVDTLVEKVQEALVKDAKLAAELEATETLYLKAKAEEKNAMEMLKTMERNIGAVGSKSCKDLTEARSTAETCKKEKDAAVAKLESTERTLNNKIKMIENLKLTRHTAEDEAKRLKEWHEKLEEKNSNLRRELASLESKVQASEGALREAKKQKKSLEKEKSARLTEQERADAAEKRAVLAEEELVKLKASLQPAASAHKSSAKRGADDHLLEQESRPAKRARRESAEEENEGKSVMEVMAIVEVAEPEVPYSSSYDTQWLIYQNYLEKLIVAEYGSSGKWQLTVERASCKKMALDVLDQIMQDKILKSFFKRLEVKMTTNDDGKRRKKEDKMEHGKDLGGVTNGLLGDVFTGVQQINVRVHIDGKSEKKPLFAPDAEGSSWALPLKDEEVTQEAAKLYEGVGRLFLKAIIAGADQEAATPTLIPDTLLNPCFLHLCFDRGITQNGPNGIMTSEDVEDALQSMLSIGAFGLWPIEKLIENGATMDWATGDEADAGTPVTAANHDMYRRRLLEHLLSNRRKAFECMKEGLFLTCGETMERRGYIPPLQMFSSKQLKVLLCGKVVNPELIIAALEFEDFKGGMGPADTWQCAKMKATKEWLLQFISGLDIKECETFLNYCAARQRIPYGNGSSHGAKDSKFVILVTAYGESEKVNAFPHSTTCFNQLWVPQYSNYDNLQKSFRLAFNWAGDYFGAE